MMKPAEFWVREDVYYTYACKNCEQETGEANIVKADVYKRQAEHRVLRKRRLLVHRVTKAQPGITGNRQAGQHLSLIHIFPISTA